MSEITINGEPVPEMAGNAPVRWEDKPNRHAYCDAEIRRLRGALECAGANPAAVPVPLDDLAAAGLLAERAQDALAQLQAENEHLKSALARDNEGVRLWMLDCARLVNRHRERGDRAEAALAGAAKAERERIRGLFDEWITLAMSEPNSHPPEAWKIAFADLIGDEPQFPLARPGVVEGDGNG